MQNKKDTEAYQLLLLLKKESTENLAGGLLWIIVVTVSTGIPILLLWVCHTIHPLLRLLVESLLCWQMLATKSLKDETMKVYDTLKNGTLEQSRYAVSIIVGRDTARLDADGITRAAVETVAENTSDGIVAPLILLAIGGAPCAVRLCPHVRDWKPQRTGESDFSLSHLL